MMPEDFYKKNLEMWEQFTSNYMDTMFKTVEKAMDQSETFRDRVDKAVAEAVSSQMDATLATLKSLQKQVENLSKKVDQLIDDNKA